MKAHKIFEVFEDRRRLYTKDLGPARSVYGERLVKKEGVVFREWDASRSKIGAAIKKGIGNLGLRSGDAVLYLGSASGTTVSHISDMVGRDGIVFAIDISARVIRDLLFLAQERGNIAPMLTSAAHPDTFRDRMCEVDWLFQDVSQKNQAQIFLKNVKTFLKAGGFAAISVKSRSIDITKTPAQVFKEVRFLLEKEVTIVDERKLDPFQKDHIFFLVKKK